LGWAAADSAAKERVLDANREHGETGRRIGCAGHGFEREAAAWNAGANRDCIKINWQFTRRKARKKFSYRRVAEVACHNADREVPLLLLQVRVGVPPPTGAVEGRIAPICPAYVQKGGAATAVPLTATVTEVPDKLFGNGRLLASAWLAGPGLLP
jgi:hypothetical protein